MVSDNVTIIIMVLTIIKFVENKTRRKLKFVLFIYLFIYFELGDGENDY